MDVTEEQLAASHRVYTRGVLEAYDLFALGASSRFIWRCPARKNLEHYNEHVSGNHLDIGVGSGYFLDHCRFPLSSPRLALMDLNHNSLDFTAKRIARYNPEIYHRNILEPIFIDAPKFDSVGLNYVLHCVPGSIESKAVALDHIKTLMNPNAIFFGATLLQGGVRRTAAARQLMNTYNKKGIFSNRDDTLEGLQKELGKRFEEISVEVIGCAAIFSGRA